MGATEVTASAPQRPLLRCCPTMFSREVITYQQPVLRREACTQLESKERRRKECTVFPPRLHQNVIPSNLVTLRNVTRVWLRGTGRSCSWKPFTRKSSRLVAGLDGTLLLFRERPGQARCKFATARVVTPRASHLWFHHSRRPSESCRGFVRSVEQVKPDRPSLSALCGAPAWGPPVPSHRGTVRICERCVHRSRPDAQHCSAITTLLQGHSQG